MSDFLLKRDDLHDSRWQDAPPAPLAPGHARLKVDKFALTANNVTYAAFGEAMGYWNFFPAPDGYGRVPVWGLATVIESNAEGVPSGQRFYGYLPISDTFDVRPAKVSPASFLDSAAHRAGLAPIYNTYVSTAADPLYRPEFEAEQMLLRPLFTTGWMIDDSLMETGASIPETVVISSASSKTALALAHRLKTRGTVDTVALTSARNKAFVESTGLYGRVRTYEDVDRLHARGLTAYADFLGRPSLTADVHAALADRLVRSLIIGATDWQASRAPLQMAGPQPEFFFVPTYAAERAKALGPDEMNRRVGEAMLEFYKAAPAFMKVTHASGRDAIQSAWANTLSGDAPPSQGLIFSL